LAAALESCRRAIVLNPNLSEAHSNLGHVLADQGDLLGTLDHYDRALALKPDAACARLRNSTPRKSSTTKPCCTFSAAISRPAGKITNTAATLGPSANRNEIFPSRWTGQPLRAARILLHAEQGIGDTLHFARYVPLVAARNATVILEVPPELRSLCAGMEGASQVIVRSDQLPDFEWHCPLLSLPLAFRTELQTIPANVPYFRPNPAAVQTLSQPCRARAAASAWFGPATLCMRVTPKVPFHSPSFVRWWM
jgi:tetratricopeptide (TPR) repeat protein